jgi:hypothetical protein
MVESADAALVELRDGRIGLAALKLLRRLGRQCTRSARRNFPPPEGYDRWSDDTVDDLLADFFARPDADNPDECHKFVLDCYARSTDVPSLERLLLAAIENFLKDEAKKTERGKLRRRLIGLLRKDARFTECAGDRWGLAGGSREPWQGDLAALERAAFAVRGVELPSWNHAGPTPQATVSALPKTAAGVGAGDGGAASAGAVGDEGGSTGCAGRSVRWAGICRRRIASASACSSGAGSMPSSSPSRCRSAW